MKIWIQSCAPLHHETRNDYQAALKKHVKRIARENTHCEFHGVDNQIPGMITSYSGENLCGLVSTRNAITAEKEGYDAFLMSSVPDSGYFQIKELVDIPVVFITEASIHVALMHGHKFGFLTVNDFFLSRLMEIARRYGLSENMVQGETVDITYANDFPVMFKNPQKYIDMIEKAVKIMASRGANIIIPGPVPINMLLLEQGVREIASARILDVFTCGVKMAELMVDLKKCGMTRSKHGVYSAPPPEILKTLKEIYQSKF